MRINGAVNFGGKFRRKTQEAIELAENEGEKTSQKN